MRGKAKVGREGAHGPDWTDIATTMRAIEVTHSATLELKISTDGAKFAGSVAVELTAALPLLEGQGAFKKLSLFSVWPSVKAATMEGLIYQMLIRFDHRIGQAYKQSELPGT